AAAVALSDECFDLSDNFITVVRETPNGGMVAMPNGETTRYTCPGDGMADIVMFDSSGTSSGPYAYVITDENNIILALPAGDSNDFDGAPAGTCRVWGLAYTGNVTAAVGDDAAAVALSDDCFDLSDNFITVVRETPNGGMVAMPNGETTRYTCPGDGMADIVMFDSSGTSSGPYAYVITDENNIILALPAGDSNDFDNAPAGTCRVWGLAYTGNLTAAVGDDAAAVALSDDCFDLSDNFITVIREAPDGGTVALSDGTNLAFTCPGDGNPDILMFDSAGTAGPFFAYVITDEQNIILDLPGGDSFDFDGAPAGICRVWGLAYTGNITAAVGDTANTAILTDDCFDLSDNFIAVVRQQPEAGLVQMPNGETTRYTCPGDGNPDIVMFDSLGAGITPYAYVITDENNIILALPAGDSNDFDGAPAGTCRVWGLAYTGNVTATVGDDAAATALSDDCFDLSDNFITVIREVPDGGTVAMPNGETTRYTCPGDGVADIVMFDSSGTSSGPYAYVITDENNIILALPGGDSNDFDSAPAGTCRVWGLAYTGSLTAAVGDDAAAVDLSDDCFDLSDNFITVIRQQPDGGTVATEDGENLVAICPGDGNPDIVRFDSSGTAGQYAYVVTDEDNIILALPPGDMVDFDLAGIGTCRVWGLAYTGNITAGLGDNAAAIALSDDCFDLSDNFITVIREVPNGGTVAMPNGETVRYTCPGDGMADIVMFDSSGTSGLYVYVVTDNDFNVLAVPDGDSFDFESAPAGECLVWGLAYSGNLTVEVGDNAATDPLSTDCYDLSDNFILVIRQVPDGGTVSMPNGDTIRYTCPGDGNPDIVQFNNTGTIGQYVYVITDEENDIIALPDGDSADFDGAPAGECRVWGLAYTGNVTAEIGDNVLTMPLGDDCFDLSDNYITIIKQIPEAGEIGTLAGPISLDICVGDGVPDSITFIADGASGNSYLFVVTDENDFIISALDDPVFDFDNAVSGTYHVYGLAYTGQPVVVPGDDLFGVDLSTDCYDLTNNFVEIVATGVDGATIFTSMGVGVDLINLCVGDGVADSLEFFTTTNALSAGYAFAITNENDVVIGFLPASNIFNFELAGMGVAKVWGISYTGNLTVNVGQVITEVQLSDGCNTLSENVITIIRDFPEGGQVATDEGETDILVCLGPDDGIVNFTTTSTAINAYVYLLTDTNFIVLDIYDEATIDFSALPQDDYLVIGLSYTGMLNSFIGEDALEADLATSCFELSGNFVYVSRGPAVDGGVVSTAGGLDTVYQCPGDGIADLVQMQTSSQDLVYRYIITDENDRVIVADVINPVIDFEGAGVGTYHVWGVSVTGPITLGFNDNLLSTPVSESCFELSENFITVIREAPDGGMVFTSDGADGAIVMVGDSIPDEITFISVGASNSNFVFVITDEDNVIMNVINGDTFDFEGATPGICRVWGLAYTGNLIAMPGDTASTAILTDDCWDLSDNFVLIDRMEVVPPRPAPATGQQAAILAMEITPNPAVSNAVISFTLGLEAEPVSTLRIMDGNGRMIQAERVASTAGENRYELQIGNWSGGLYVAYLINGTEIKAKKLMVARP
ncbi:MAG: T9SS type A sorting domain-containing protein, partial [Phaeodactylibacter sp.]|nr:T9SS type A sorting domain-containing protein [Phaeodactylibacter sp.]